MKLLRTALLVQAGVWAACGLAVAIAPRWVLVSLFDQPAYPDYAYVRVSGAMAVGLALIAVLIAQRLDDVWWWAWGLALVDAAIVTITTLNALVGLPDGAGALLWWIFAGVNAALAAAVLAGMARAGQEKPFA